MRILAVFKFKFEFNSDRILICRPVMHGCTCHARILTYRPVSHGCTCQYPHLRPVMHGCPCHARILTYRPVSHGCTCENPHLRPVIHGCTCQDPHLQICLTWLHLPGSSPTDLSHMAAPVRILTYRPVSYGCTCQNPHLLPVMHGCTCQDPHLQTYLTWLHLSGSSPTDLSHMAAPASILICYLSCMAAPAWILVLCSQ